VVHYAVYSVVMWLKYGGEIGSKESSVGVTTKFGRVAPSKCPKSILATLPTIFA
jgi:hypothetical protein